MKNLILLLSVLFYSSCSTAERSPKSANDFEKVSQYICDQIVAEPSFVYGTYFGKAFRDAVPYEGVVGIFKQINGQYGNCDKVENHSEDGLNGMFFTIHKGKKLRFIMNLKEEEGVNKIAGLLYKGPPSKPTVFNSKEEIYEAIRKNPHRLRLLFRKLGGGAHLEHNQKGGEALGSVFKLYILAALIEKINRGELSWDQKFPIKEEHKSLPSGRMQDLKNGTMVSIKKFATEMIRISDNTATDHLLAIVGAPYVEKHMQLNRLNSYTKKTVPFLSTLDMFKTRAFFTKEQANKYAKSSRYQRRQMIKAIPYKNRDDLMNRLQSWQKPRFNEQIEWFASANNICDLYDWMDKQKNPGMREVISANTPFIDLKKSKRWKFAGYKGGSEPGVLEMAYLLEDKKGQRWCFYMGQSSQTEAFPQGPFFSIVEGIFKFLDGQ